MKTRTWYQGPSDLGRLGGDPGGTTETLRKEVAPSPLGADGDPGQGKGRSRGKTQVSEDRVSTRAVEDGRCPRATPPTPYESETRDRSDNSVSSTEEIGAWRTAGAQSHVDSSGLESLQTPVNGPGVWRWAGTEGVQEGRSCPWARPKSK